MSTYQNLDKETVLTAMTTRWPDFYGQFTELKPQGGELRGSCPLHQGSQPSFTVSSTQGTWYCHSECQVGGDAFEFLKRHKGLSFPEALADLAEFAGVGSAEGAAAASQNDNSRTNKAILRRRVATYDYQDENAKLLYRVQRWEPKGFSQAQPNGKGGWINNLNGIRRVLYRLPEVLAAKQSGKTIYICEGEKDVERLCSAGLAATCNSGGAGKWEAAFCEWLEGACVVILPDADAPGRSHAAKVAASLWGKAKQIRIAELPDLPDKGDISDWLDAGHTADELETLIETIPVWTPAQEAVVSPASLPSTQTAIGFTRKPLAECVIDLADVPPPSPNLPLLFGRYLLKGAVHWLTGQTGIGKSTLIYNIVCALAEGTHLWGIECEQQGVLYLDMESGQLGRSLKLERLYEGKERVRNRLFFLPEPLQLPAQMPELLTFVKERNISLVVFDTARRVFRVRDENDNAEFYNIVVPVLDSLKSVGVASLTLGHPPKNGGETPRGAGGQGEACDLIMLLTMHQGEVGGANGQIKLTVTKDRILGLDGMVPLLLQRQGKDHFQRVTANNLNEEEDAPPRSGDRCDEAILNLLEQQDGKPLRHTDIVTRLKDKDFAEGTIKRRISSLQERNKIGHDLKGGYILSGPKLQIV